MRASIHAPLTGFIGERTNRAAALMTDDFRIYHELAPWFEARGVQLLGIRSDDEIPPSVRVILGGPPDDPRSVPLPADPEAAWLLVCQGLDARRNGGPYRRAVIGVDPGATIGVALLADGAVFIVAECHAPADVARRLRVWRPSLRADAWAIHIGDGAPDVGQAIADEARRTWPDAKVSFIPEQASSPPAPATMSRHTDAAIYIAMRGEP